MSQFCFANFVRLLKKHEINKKISNERFIEDFFTCILDACEVFNGNSETYWCTKEFTSLLLNRKEELPTPIRNCILQVNESELNEGLASFYKEHLNRIELEHLYQQLVILFCEDKLIHKSKKEFVKNSEYNLNLITHLLVESALVKNKITKLKFLIYKQGKTEILYSFDDLLKIGFNFKDSGKKKIVVIPFDAEFHVHISELGERPAVVSEKSLHGKWLLRMKKNGFTEDKITQLIQNGKHKTENEIGNISTITIKNTEFYLLPISKFDENNVAHSSEECIKKSLTTLLKYYDQFGNAYDLYIPLLGTGSSRAKLFHKESFELIKNHLIENINLFNGSITIIIYANDFNEMEAYINAL